MILSRHGTRLRWKRVGLFAAAGLIASFAAGYGLSSLRAPDTARLLARERIEGLCLRRSLVEQLQKERARSDDARAEAERLARLLDESEASLAHSQRLASANLIDTVLDSGPYQRYEMPSETVDIKAENEPIRDLMAVISRQVGREIVVDADIDERVSLELRGVPWSSAARLMAKLADCVYEETDTGARLSRPRDLTIQAADADLRSVITMIASHGGKSVVIAPEVRGRVSLDLKDIRWDRALNAILETHDCEAIHDGLELIRVVKRR